MMNCPSAIYLADGRKIVNLSPHSCNIVTYYRHSFFQKGYKKNYFALYESQSCDL